MLLMRGGGPNSRSFEDGQPQNLAGSSGSAVAPGRGPRDFFWGGAGSPVVIDTGNGLSVVEQMLERFTQVMTPMAVKIGRALSLIADGARGQRRSDWDRRFKLKIKPPWFTGDSNLFDHSRD